jgi:transposase
VIKLGEVVMILDLHRQGLSVSAIALQLSIDRKTVRKYLARGLEAPVYRPRERRPRRIDPFIPYLRARVEAWPGLTGRRLWRELKERGYQGGDTAVTDALRERRPPAARFRSPLRGRRPATRRRWTSPSSRWRSPTSRASHASFGCFPWCSATATCSLRASSCIRNLQTVLRCHMATFAALGGVPRQILYHRMKTAVSGEDALGHIVYDRVLVTSPATTVITRRPAGRTEPRPRARWSGRTASCARTSSLPAFRNLDDLHAQLRHWLDTVANPRVHRDHATGRRRGFCRGEAGSPAAAAGALPLGPKLQRRVSHEGMVSVGGNFYSVPDITRIRLLEVHALVDEIQIFEAGHLIAGHPVLEGRNQRPVAPGSS